MNFVLQFYSQKFNGGYSFTHAFMGSLSVTALSRVELQVFTSWTPEFTTSSSSWLNGEFHKLQSQWKSFEFGEDLCLRSIGDWLQFKESVMSNPYNHQVQQILRVVVVLPAEAHMMNLSYRYKYPKTIVYKQ